MRKDVYEKPDIDWLKGKFKGLKLGWLKASEEVMSSAFSIAFGFIQQGGLS